MIILYVALCSCVHIVTGFQHSTLGHAPSRIDSRQLLTLGVSGTAHTSSTLGLRLYCSVPRDRNVVLSPVSITAGLSVLYMGARGETAVELEKAVGFQGQPQDEGLHLAIGQMSAKRTGRDFTFKSANNVFVNPERPILPYFTSLANQAYGIIPTVMDFRTDPESKRAEINTWVAGQTEGEILDLLPPGAISEATQLVLVNAVYFSAKWASAFAPEKTSKQEFKQENGQAVMVDMMLQEGYFNYGFDKDLGTKILELPYSDNQFSMFLFLPRYDKSLIDFEQELCGMGISLEEYILKQREQISPKTVEVTLPRFTVQDELPLHAILPTLGISSLFQENSADLSGIDGTRNLFVAQAQHKAIVKVDESGTTASAATAAQVQLRSLPPQFLANHPFMFSIFDNRNRAVLFLGRMSNPSA